MFENEGGDGCADGAGGDRDSYDPLDDACAGFGDTGLETAELGFDTGEPGVQLGLELDKIGLNACYIGFGGDGFDESLAERVGGGSSLLLGERSSFEPTDVGEPVEEDLGGHACELIIRSADSELGPFVRAA